MVRHYRWLTGRRNQEHRSGGFQGPVCSRHSHMRYEEAAGSSGYLSEEERRERRRRRELRSRLREEDDDYRVEREKKRSVRSRICAWLNCFCGILIVLGLVFVFYVITTLIIDGSSPLDFISFSNNNTSLTNSSTTHNFSTPLDSSNRNDKKKKNVSKETILKEKSIPVPTIPIELSTKDPVGKSKGSMDPKRVLKSSINNHNQRGLEDEKARIKYVKGSDGRSYIAFVPAHTMNTSTSSEVPLKKVNHADVNRNGQSSLWEEYDPGRKFEDLTDRHRPERDRGKYPYQTPTDSFDLGSGIIHQYARAPSNRRRKEHFGSSSNRRRYSSPISGTRFDPSVRISPYNMEIENNYKRHRPYRRNFGSPDGKRMMRDHYRTSSPNPEEYVGGVKSYPRGRIPPRHDTRNRFLPDISQRRNPSSSTIKRPPRDFRYPPSAVSIQDILAHMKGEVRTDNRQVSSSVYGDYKSSDGFHKYTVPSEFYFGNQDHIEYDEAEDDLSNRRKVLGKDRRPYLTDGSRTTQLDRDTFDNHYYNTKHHDRSRIQGHDHERDHLPPVLNSYDVADSGGLSRSGKPLRLILDIYPVDSHSRSSLTDIYRSTVTVEEDFRRRDMNVPLEVDENPEFILHVNLLTEQPTHRSEPELRDKTLSLEIPLKGGSITPLDIYKALVEHVRKSPIAAHQKVQGQGSGNSQDQSAVHFLANPEENQPLLSAIEEGLLELNSHLPYEYQFSTDKKPKNHFPIPQKYVLERSPRGLH